MLTAVCMENNNNNINEGCCLLVLVATAASTSTAGSSVTSRTHGVVHRVNDHVWLFTAGLSGDARALASHLRTARQQHRLQIGEAMTVREAAERVAQVQHELTTMGERGHWDARLWSGAWTVTIALTTYHRACFVWIPEERWKIVGIVVRVKTKIDPWLFWVNTMMTFVPVTR